LASVLYLVRHTPLHLALARDVATRSGQRELAAFFDDKLAGEAGHDVWAENDLTALSRRFLLEAEVAPASAIVALVRDLEALIRRDPAAYLPYIFFAEYVTVLVGPFWVSMLDERCGVPAQTLSVVSQHAELDREHIREGREAIDRLLASTQEPALLATLALSMRHFTAFCDELLLQQGERAA